MTELADRIREAIGGVLENEREHDFDTAWATLWSADAATEEALAWLTEQREQIARTLGEHEPFGGSYCTCSPEDADGAHEPFPQRYWEDHLADAVLALLAGFAAGQVGAPPPPERPDPLPNPVIPDTGPDPRRSS